MSGFARLGFLLDRDVRAITLALALLLVALLVPRIELPRDAYDYVVIFDISQSMNVEDYEAGGAPMSRLAYARAAARRVLRELPCGSRIGWGAFTGYRTILLLAPVEICANYDDLLASLARIDERMRWSNASEITKGLYWTVLAAQQTGSHPDIVFMSDGHEAPPLDPAYPPRMLEDIQGAPVRGWLIGTGGFMPSPIPKIDEEGRRQGYWRADEVIQQLRSPGEGAVAAGPGEHLSALHEAHLKELAAQLGFQYARLGGPGSLRAAMRDKRFVRRRPAPTDVYWLPAAAAVLLLALRFRPERTGTAGAKRA